MLHKVVYFTKITAGPPTSEEESPIPPPFVGVPAVRFQGCFFVWPKTNKINSKPTRWHTGQVWYEWAVTTPTPQPIHNPGGRSCATFWQDVDDRTLATFENTNWTYFHWPSWDWCDPGELAWVGTCSHVFLPTLYGVYWWKGYLEDDDFLFKEDWWFSLQQKSWRNGKSTFSFVVSSIDLDHLRSSPEFGEYHQESFAPNTSEIASPKKSLFLVKCWNPPKNSWTKDFDDWCLVPQGICSGEGENQPQGLKVVKLRCWQVLRGKVSQPTGVSTQKLVDLWRKLKRFI